MKMKIIFISLWLIQFIVIFNACEIDKETIVNPKQYSNLNNNIDTIGEIHNKLILFSRGYIIPHDTNHFQLAVRNGDSILITINYLNNIRNAFIAYLQLRGWNQDNIQIAIETFNNILSNAELITEYNGNIYLKDIRFQISNLINTYQNLGLLSNDERNLIAEIITKIESLNYRAADSLISVLNVSNLDYNNYPALYHMKSVHYHSRLLWDSIYSCSMNKNSGKIIDIKVTEREFWIAIYDAIGALIGSGWVSAVTSAGLSLLAAVIWDTLEEANKCVCPICKYYGLD